MPNLTQWHQRFTHQLNWTGQVREFLFQKAALPPEPEIIEIGCGTGAVIPHLPTETHSYGLDINRAFLAHAVELNPQVCFTCGDAHALPLTSNHFDAVFCHFLLLWVADPVVVLAEMSRICKPGGAVLILAEPDYGGRIDYPDALAQLGSLQTGSLRTQGADPLIGRKLPGLMQNAGLENIQIGIIGSQWQPPVSPEQMTSEWQTLRHDLSTLPDEQFNRYLDEDQAAWEDGSRVLFVPTFYAYGEVP